MGKQTLNLRLKRFQLSQIDDTDCTTANLVFVSRADAALGRADLKAFGSAFAHSVKFTMNRKNQRSVFCNTQTSGVISMPCPRSFSTSMTK